MSKSKDNESHNFYCPVCEQGIEYIWVWQESGSERARIFCQTCANLPEYTDLLARTRETQSLDYAGFREWTAQRMLNHVLAKERGKRSRVEASLE